MEQQSGRGPTDPVGSQIARAKVTKANRRREAPVVVPCNAGCRPARLARWRSVRQFAVRALSVRGAMGAKSFLPQNALLRRNDVENRFAAVVVSLRITF